MIPGELTKDGERVGHKTMAKLLKQISEHGIKIFVFPRNHDINNPEAASYDKDNATPAQSISASDFADLYSPFGYKNTIYRDVNSLSYVCQPSSNVGILGIYNCKYYQNVPGGLAIVS